MTRFLDNLEEAYYDILNDIHYELNTTNKKYQDNVEKLCEIVEKYPGVKSICEDQKAVALDIEEAKKLIEYLECQDNLYDMKNQKLLYRGAKYLYVFLKNADLLK